MTEGVKGIGRLVEIGTVAGHDPAAMPETHIARKDDNVWVYLLIVSEYIGMIEDDESLAAHHLRGWCWSVCNMSDGV